MPQSRSYNLADYSDERLIERYQQGDREVLELLIRRYRQELFHFLVRFLANRAAAEDIFQETFLQVHNSADSFDVNRRFKPWLFTIAANKARDFMRKRRRRPTVPLDAQVRDADGSRFVDLMEADLPMPDERMDRAELAERVRQAVEDLPDHLREILLLAYFQQFSYNEIAEALAIPLGTVKSRLHAAVAAFAKKWEAANPDDPSS